MNTLVTWIVVAFGIVCLSKISALPIEDSVAARLDKQDVSPNEFRKHHFSHLLSEKALVDLATFVADISDFRFTCQICIPMFTLIENSVSHGKPVDEIRSTMVNFCITFKIAPVLVCEGAVGKYASEVSHIVKISGISTRDICGFIVGDKCEPPGFEQRFNWSVKAYPTPKPPIKPLRPPQNGKPIKRVLHLSDTHLDPYYEEGSSAVCDLPLCCRSSVGMLRNASDAAGKWGDHRRCDTPFRTLDHMMKHIAQTEKDIDYIVWTGDLPAHDSFNQTKEGVLQHNHNVYTMFSQYFPNTPIFPALGNHESDPINSFPQPDVTDEEHSISWLYTELSKSWPKLMLQKPDFNTDTMLKGGYYSILVEPGFRIISMNMNYGHRNNFWLLRDSDDPADHLAWLTKELGKAEANGEKVHLLGHIPPGTDEYLPIWGRNFRQIINRFENTVTAQFYGHTHYDELIVFHDDDLKRATNIAYVGPSTTTYSFLNPAYRIYTVDGHYSDSTRMVIDGVTYYMNITEANSQDKPEWKKLYSYKEDYGMESLTPSDWSNFVRRLPTDDALLQKFFNHFHRKSESFPVCNAVCMQQMICKLVTAVAFDHSVCKEMGIVASTRLFQSPGVLSYDRP